MYLDLRSITQEEESYLTNRVSKNRKEQFKLLKYMFSFNTLVNLVVHLIFVGLLVSVAYLVSYGIVVSMPFDEIALRNLYTILVNSVIITCVIEVIVLTLGVIFGDVDIMKYIGFTGAELDDNSVCWVHKKSVNTGVLN